MPDLSDIQDHEEASTADPLAERERARLSQYDNVRAITEREAELHRSALRDRGFCLAAGVLTVIFIFEGVLLCLLWGMSRDHGPPPISLIALSIAQVVSITTITLMILFAVFRGFRARDLNDLPIKTLERVARESSRLISNNPPDP